MKVLIGRRHRFTDDSERDLSGKDLVAELGNRVERARAMLPLQADPALAQAMSFDEIDKERRFQQWLRDQSRRQRKRLAKCALTPLSIASTSRPLGSGNKTWPIAGGTSGLWPRDEFGGPDCDAASQGGVDVEVDVRRNGRRLGLVGDQQPCSTTKYNCRARGCDR
ncbi:hypothetical protein ACQP1G_25640 [Nocardia sp. CA-107356]|uniref:hypothetical protein n=1 Tax=Nocardia sp. CA-107356 TaxID=3239972 RepID=UPI003D8A8980